MSPRLDSVDPPEPTALTGWPSRNQFRTSIDVNVVLYNQIAGQVLPRVPRLHLLQIGGRTRKLLRASGPSLLMKCACANRMDPIAPDSKTFLAF